MPLTINFAPMKVTFILKGLSQAFYDGIDSVNPELRAPGLNNLPHDRARFDLLANMRHGLGVKSKVGDGSFRDKVDFNMMMRDTNKQPSLFKIEPRKGYKLATFEFN